MLQQKITEQLPDGGEKLTATHYENGVKSREMVVEQHGDTKQVTHTTFDAEGRYPVNELRIEQDGTGKRKETTTRFGPEGVKVEEVSAEAGPDGEKITLTKFDKTGETPLKRSIEETGADGRPLRNTKTGS